MLKLVLVRHAQAETNLIHAIGRNNHVQLTDKGTHGPFLNGQTKTNLHFCSSPPIITLVSLWWCVDRQEAGAEARAVLARAWRRVRPRLRL
jgi:hypothetical protein